MKKLILLLTMLSCNDTVLCKEVYEDLRKEKAWAICMLKYSHKGKTLKYPTYTPLEGITDKHFIVRYPASRKTAKRNRKDCVIVHKTGIYINEKRFN